MCWSPDVFRSFYSFETSTELPIGVLGEVSIFQSLIFVQTSHLFGGHLTVMPSP